MLKTWEAAKVWRGPQRAGNLGTWGRAFGHNKGTAIHGGKIRATLQFCLGNDQIWSLAPSSTDLCTPKVRFDLPLGTLMSAPLVHLP